jgi:hypothetical protein
MKLKTRMCGHSRIDGNLASVVNAAHAVDQFFNFQIQQAKDISTQPSTLLLRSLTETRHA